MKVVKVERSKHKKDRVLVFGAESELLRMTEAELLRFDIYPGRELTEAEVAAVSDAARHSELSARAARISAGRMISRRDLSSRLQRSGATPEEAETLAARMEELGAVDDAAYAGVVARHYAAMGYGRSRVEQELYRRGIPKELWGAALEELPPPDEAIRRFLQDKRRGDPSDRAVRKKLTDALLRRGFSWNEIRPALQELGEELPEEE